MAEAGRGAGASFGTEALLEGSSGNAAWSADWDGPSLGLVTGLMRWKSDSSFAPTTSFDLERMRNMLKNEKWSEARIANNMT